MKLWLAAFLRWVGMLTVVEFAAIRAADNQRIRDEYRSVIGDLKAEHEADVARLIQELNELRNTIPATAVQDAARPPVRVLRNFREFRSIVENKPIRIERTH